MKRKHRHEPKKLRGPAPALRKQWTEEQLALKKGLICDDRVDFAIPGSDDPSKPALRLIGGVDISFVKDSVTEACASLVVLELPSLRVVYESMEMVHLTAPYLSGFLAFREVLFLQRLIKRLKAHRPDLVPQVLLVDGNGVLHPRGFGSACHLGVLEDIPTVGVGKTFLCVDGLKTERVKQQVRASLHHAGDQLPIVGESGTTFGIALRATEEAANPIFVSIGHRLSLASAVAVVRSCSRLRIPEPVRQATQDKATQDKAELDQATQDKATQDQTTQDKATHKMRIPAPVRQADLGSRKFLRRLQRRLLSETEDQEETSLQAEQEVQIERAVQMEAPQSGRREKKTEPKWVDALVAEAGDGNSRHHKQLINDSEKPVVEPPASATQGCSAESATSGPWVQQARIPHGIIMPDMATVAASSTLNPNAKSFVPADRQGQIKGMELSLEACPSESAPASVHPPLPQRNGLNSPQCARDGLNSPQALPMKRGDANVTNALFGQVWLSNLAATAAALPLPFPLLVLSNVARTLLLVIGSSRLWQVTPPLR